LYKISGNRGDADSFFYYTERSKLNSLLSFTKISSRPNFSFKSIKQVQSALTNNQSIVQYFNNYASGNYALLFLKDTFHLIDLGDDVFFDFKNKMNLPIESVYAFRGQDVLGFAFPKGSALRQDFDRFLIKLGPEKLKEIIDNASK
jgi:hypothetical protein